MVNYYEEFNIDRAKSISEINTELTKEESVWQRRMVTTPEKAMKILSMIAEAREVFSSESARSKYDRDLENSKNQPKPESAAERREKWIEQARMFFNDGSYDLAKVAIQNALRFSGSSENTEILSLAADIYRGCKEYHTAMDYINRAIVLVPTDAYLYLIKAFICFEDVNSYGRNYNVCVEDGRKTLNIALSKAKAANDDNMQATILGAIARSYYMMSPIDKKKAAELAQESVSVGVDKWGNAQDVLNKIESERKAAEQAEKARLEREESERKVREAKAERERKEAEEKQRRKEAEKRVYTKWKIKYVLAWVFFIGLWILTIVSHGIPALFIFFVLLSFVNYTDVAYIGGSKITIIMSIISCWVLMNLFVVSAGIEFLIIGLPLSAIGCIVISRLVGGHTNPIGKDIEREIIKRQSIAPSNSESKQ